jgi:hypothetical protein
VKLAIKLFGDDKVTEFEVRLATHVGQVVTFSGTTDKAQLCTEISLSTGLLIIRTLDDMEVLTTFPLANVVSVTPTRFGEKDEETPRP